MKKYAKELIMISLVIVLFVVVSLFVFVFNGTEFDIQVFETVDYIKSDFLTGFFKFITFFGGKIFTIIFVVLTSIVLINRKKSTYRRFVKNEKTNNILNMMMPWFIFVLAVLLVTVLFLVLKEVFARPRPIEWFMINEHGWSYPSGHTATSFAMFGSFALLINTVINKKWLRVLIASSAVMLSWTIAFSRVYLGVHHLTDILAGACIGVIVVCIASMLLKLLKT